VVRRFDARYCSFCGKKREDVYMLIAGPGIDTFICDECVTSAGQIITQRRIEDATTASLRLVQTGAIEKEKAR
jgi:ATP-dependent protease Clp ATPase subunit